MLFVNYYSATESRSKISAMSSMMNPLADDDADDADEFDFDAMEINPDADERLRFTRDVATPETSGQRCLLPTQPPGLPVSIIPF